MTSGDSPPRGAPLAWDERGQPFSTRFDDVYFAKQSGLDESRYVFIERNHLPQRWAALAADAQFTIGETGFGTGLNFLVAWEAWRVHAPETACLHFISLEKYPLSRAQLRQALALWPTLAPLALQLLEAYPALPAEAPMPDPAPDFQRLSFDQGRVQLTLIVGDAVAGLRQLLPLVTPGPKVSTANPTWAGRAALVNAWFLDGFAPAKNPDMWSEELFRVMGRLSAGDATCATFSAAAVVKQGLKVAGFAITKAPGFGRKRDMLCGEFTRVPTPEPRTPSRRPHFDPSWHLMAAGAVPASKRVLVIGAGLAGCHTARALAERGYSVTVLDKGAIASGASGNPQGVVYAKASVRAAPLTHFNLAALQFANRFYHSRIGYQSCGAASGVIHVAQTPEQQAEYRRFAAAYEHEPEFVHWLEPEYSEGACGVPLPLGGLLFPQAGWLNPAQLCAELLAHPNITCHQQAEVARLVLRNSLWLALGPDDTTLAEAPVAVIAMAVDAARLEHTAHLPLKAIRGQITTVGATEASAKLTRVLCGSGYVAPAHDGNHCLGASFNLHSTSPAPDPADDTENLRHTSRLSPALQDWQAPLGNRVSFRCTTPDYLPLVGAAPLAPEFCQTFAAYRRTAKAHIDATGSYHPGLFVNLAHGSRGLAYTPLCAELVASLISGTPLPVPRSLALHLHPARFLVRDLQRNRL